MYPISTKIAQMVNQLLDTPTVNKLVYADNAFEVTAYRVGATIRIDLKQVRE